MAKRKDPIKRFWLKVEKTDTCWLWTGLCWRHGYGRMHVSPERRDVPAHVFSYELHHGRPAERFVLHTCDVRHCVNPDHLWEGTQQENLDDMAAKGRSTRGETNGNSKLTAEQALIAKTSSERPAVLAARFGVSEALIYAIRGGYCWRWL